MLLRGAAILLVVLAVVFAVVVVQYLRRPVYHGTARIIIEKDTKDEKPPPPAKLTPTPSFFDIVMRHRDTASETERAELPVSGVARARDAPLHFASGPCASRSGPRAAV